MEMRRHSEVVEFCGSADCWLRLLLEILAGCGFPFFLPTSGGLGVEGRIGGSAARVHREWHSAVPPSPVAPEALPQPVGNRRQKRMPASGYGRYKLTSEGGDCRIKYLG